MRPKRAAALVVCVVAASLVAAFAGTGLSSHGPQKWAGQWFFTHTSGPTSGVTGGFALRHETDDFGAELLERIGGVACAEPTDFFAGAYTVPDTEDLPPPPNDVYVDTGRFRGCTVGDPNHIRGRYQSDTSGGAAGDFDLVLSSTDPERWTGTFTVDGNPQEYTWTGFFQVHFDGDGANAVSDPPYDQEPPPTEPPPPGSEPPAPEPQPTETCNGKQATITPNPDAPPGFAISGTASDDVIVGTAGPDRILGLGGNDTICGFGGDDELVGADGDDYLEAGLGNDTLSGDAGNDTLAGDYPDHNLLAKTGGNDRLFGGDGDDWLEGGPGDDTLSGGEGADKLFGNITQMFGAPFHPESDLVGRDNDQITGDGGNDVIVAGRGDDRIDGGTGDDLLRGQKGSDVLLGGQGTDKLYAGPGNDRIDGGEGQEGKTGDLFGDVAYYFDAPSAVNINLASGRVTGGEGRDSIRNVESVIAGRFDDILRGSGGPDYLGGGSGDDDIYGMGGADWLFGQAGDDFLSGGPGLDHSFGSLGFDVCAAERRSGCERLRPGIG